MRFVLPGLGALLLAWGGTLSEDEVSIVYAPEDGTRFVRDLRRLMEAERIELLVVVDGREVEPEGGHPGQTWSHTSTLEVTDVVDGAEQGWPRDVMRTFDEIYYGFLLETEGGGPEIGVTRGSDLEGSTVLFRRDEEEGDVDVRYAEEEDGDEELLEQLEEDLDFRTFLPEGAVALGESWELGDEAYHALVWPGGYLHLRGEEESDEVCAGRFRLHRAVRAGLDVSGEATFLKVEEADAGRLAHIEFEFEVSADYGAKVAEGSGDEDPEVELSFTWSETTEGTLLWNLDHGHAQHLCAEMELESEVVTRMSFSLEAGPEVQVWTENYRESGHVGVTIERE